MGKLAKNKKEYKVYLNEENTEYVKTFLETTRNKGGLSGLVDGYIASMAKTLKASGYKSGEKITVAKMLRIAKEGFTRDPA